MIADLHNLPYCRTLLPQVTHAECILLLFESTLLSLLSLEIFFPCPAVQETQSNGRMFNRTLTRQRIAVSPSSTNRLYFKKLISTARLTRVSTTPVGGVFKILRGPPMIFSALPVIMICRDCTDIRSDTFGDTAVSSVSQYFALFTDCEPISVETEHLVKETAYNTFHNGCRQRDL